ncbi:MAG: ABC transporter permease [Eubacterium sp.]
MFKIIGLEIKKLNPMKLLRGIIIALIPIFFVQIGGLVQNPTLAFNIEDSWVNAVKISAYILMVYGGSILSKCIIEEYKNRTINALFMYPVSRATILIAKLIVIVGSTFVVIIFCSFFSFFITYAYAMLSGFEITGSMADIFSVVSIKEFWMDAIIFSIMPLIGLPLGIKRHSTVAPIIGLMIMFLLFSQLPSLSWLPIAVAAIALILTVPIVNNLIKADVS